VSFGFELKILRVFLLNEFLSSKVVTKCVIGWMELVFRPSAQVSNRGNITSKRRCGRLGVHVEGVFLSERTSFVRRYFHDPYLIGSK